MNSTTLKDQIDAKEQARKEFEEQFRYEAINSEFERKFPFNAKIVSTDIDENKALTYQDFKALCCKKFGRIHDRKTMRRLHREYLKKVTAKTKGK